MLKDATVHPTLPVTDLDKAREFYNGRLGLPLAERQFPDNVILQCGGGTTLTVYKRPTPTRADNTAAAFEVENLEQTVSDLQAAGIKFEEYDFPGLKTVNGIAEISGMKAAWFKDPEGNILGIVQAV